MESGWLAAFVRRLGELGWVKGRNVTIEVRLSEGRPERVAEIADQFVRHKFELLLLRCPPKAVRDRSTAGPSHSRTSGLREKHQGWRENLGVTEFAALGREEWWYPGLAIQPAPQPARSVGSD